MKWVKLRDEALWAVEDKADILGPRLAEYELVHDATGILAVEPVLLPAMPVIPGTLMR